VKQGHLIELPAIDQRYFEEQLYGEGVENIAGVDEVGRGCLAGPVVAASVILPPRCDIQGINDSKLLSPKKREGLYSEITSCALAYGMGEVCSDEIDKINILEATLKAMRISVDGLKVRPGYLLVDGRQSIDIDVPQRVIVKGDMRSISVGAASIVAKVARDRMMCEFEKLYPGFSFSVHKGYGTKLHLAELKKNGPTPIHRRSFAGVS